MIQIIIKKKSEKCIYTYVHLTNRWILKEFSNPLRIELLPHLGFKCLNTSLALTRIKIWIVGIQSWCQCSNHTLQIISISWITFPHFLPIAVHCIDPASVFDMFWISLSFRITRIYWWSISSSSVTLAIFLTTFNLFVSFPHNHEPLLNNTFNILIAFAIIRTYRG